MAIDPGWVGDILAGYKTILVNGSAMPQENIAAFLAGSGIQLTSTDDATNGVTNILITALGTPVGYQVARRLDLTAQGTINVSMNGNVVIAGDTWTRINQANDSTALALNSAGLTSEAAPGTHFNNGGTVTACGLYIPLMSVLPASSGSSTPLRFTAYAPSQSGGNSGPHGVLGIYNGSAECLVYSGRYITGSGASEPAHGWQLSSTPGAGTIVDSGQSAANVFQIEFPTGIGSMQAYCRSGTWSSGYPAASSMVTGYQTVPGNYSNNATFSAYIGALSQWNLFIGGCNVLSNGVGSVTIANLLVEYGI